MHLAKHLWAVFDEIVMVLDDFAAAIIGLPLKFDLMQRMRASEIAR